MPFMNWNEMLATHIESIDSQHKVLLAYINELHESMMSGAGNDKLGQILDNLVKYTVNHFGYEEDLFRQHGYQYMDEHVKLHEGLRTQVGDFVNKFKSGEITVTSDLMSFLKEWLMKHIIKEDKKYIVFLKGKGVV